MQLFKDLYNTATVSATPYGLGELLVTVYGEAAGPLMGEVTIQSLAHSSLGNFDTSVNGIVNALYYLNTRVESIRKTITTWDAYQIWGTLQDRDTILAQLAQLPANSSIVSNITEPFTWTNQGKDYIVHKGDILLKDNNENIVHIQSLSSGYYAPMKITKQGSTGNNFIIDYHYFTDTPLKDPEDPSTRDPRKTYETMPISFSVTGETDQGYSYTGILEPGNTISYPYTTSPRVEPVIKFMTEQGEQVFQNKQYESNSSSAPVKIQMNRLFVATNEISYDYYIPANAITKTTNNNYFLVNRLTFSRAVGLYKMITASDSITSNNEDLTFSVVQNNIRIEGSTLAGKTTAQAVSYFQELADDQEISITLSTTRQVFILRNTTTIPLYYEVK